MKIKETEEGLILEVFVKPKSKNSRIEIDNREAKFFCKKPPHKGKVNKELIKVFSNLFRVEVKIISGLTSNQKIILLRGLNKMSFEKIISFSRVTKDLPS
jgi:uncharacterized protein (TIGR00251 family)